MLRDYKNLNLTRNDMPDLERKGGTGSVKVFN